METKEVTQTTDEKARGVANVLAQVGGYEPALRLEVLEAALNKAAKPKRRQRGEGESSVEPIVKDWFSKLDYTSKLAVVLYSYYLDGDHGTNWIEDFRHEFESDILKQMINENSQLPDIEKKLTGLACECFVWSQHL
jgi:hypothetical protein